MLVDDLRGLFLFNGVSDEQLLELAAAGNEISFDDRTELFHEGDPADFWWVLLDGHVELVRRAGREEAVVMMTMDRPGLWAGGFRAWNDESSYLATGRGASAGRMLRVPAPALAELAHKWFPFGVHLIEGFFQTVRSMDSLSRQREALIALGQLAAGFAHEINNPASATARAVDALQDTCDTMLSSLVHLAEQSLSAEQFVALDALRREINPSVCALSIRWRSPISRTPSTTGSTSTGLAARGASRRRSRRPRSTSSGASAPARCSPVTRSSPACSGWQAHSPADRCCRR